MSMNITRVTGGGQAFPNSTPNSSMSGYGMTLRDYFAAKALVGLISEPPVQSGEPNAVARLCDKNGRTFASSYAIAAYTIADAMLAERAKDRP